MCGIVGIFAKSSAIEADLGVHLAAMLAQMGDRGPDSAGVAFYRDPVGPGSTKLTLYSADTAYDWRALGADLGTEPSVRASHAVVVLDSDAESAERLVRERHPELRVMSAGNVIEIYKEVGRPDGF